MKTVQELMTSSNGDGPDETVLQRFHRKALGGETAEEADCLQLPSQDVDVPVIDLSLLPRSRCSPSEPEADAELQCFHSALSSWGCFQAINHGMTASFLDQVREVTKEFFALPMEEKQQYMRAENGREGYGSDMVLFDGQVRDWSDRLFLLAYPEDQRTLNYWPQKPKNFREIINEYTLKVREVFDVVLKAMALSLDLESDAFVQKLEGKVNVFARFNYYPSCPRPDLVYGLRPHADGATITILLPDKDVKGLQFLRDGRWVDIPIDPRTLLINLGDEAEILSNGIFKSPMHRAIPNAESSRISLAMLCAPDAETEIEPLSELIDESRPRLYKKVKNYKQIYFRYYPQGKRAIDAVKL